MIVVVLRSDDLEDGMDVEVFPNMIKAEEEAIKMVSALVHMELEDLGEVRAMEADIPYDEESFALDFFLVEDYQVSKI